MFFVVSFVSLRFIDIHFCIHKFCIFCLSDCKVSEFFAKITISSEKRKRLRYYFFEKIYFIRKKLVFLQTEK